MRITRCVLWEGRAEMLMEPVVRFVERAAKAAKHFEIHALCPRRFFSREEALELGEECHDLRDLRCATGHGGFIGASHGHRKRSPLGIMQFVTGIDAEPW